MRKPNFVEDHIERIPFSGCWIWMGALTQGGYGSISIGGNSKKTHIVLYSRTKGEIDAHLQLDHLCRVRCCVNPDHLEPVTQKVNILRGESPTAINKKKTHCIRGHELSEANVHITKKRGSRDCRQCRNLRQAKYDKIRSNKSHRKANPAMLTAEGKL